MQRTIVQPADLSGDALTEFKDWLGISRSNEDGLLVQLLGAALAMCEAFTSKAPLEQRVEESVPANRGRYRLISRPAQLLLSVEAIGSDGGRTPIDGSLFEFEVDAAGLASIELKSQIEARGIAVQMTAGLAASWPALPKPLRQGIIRLAAFYYRDRDHEKAVQPPASVAALWRPWRVMRLT